MGSTKDNRALRQPMVVVALFVMLGLWVGWLVDMVLWASVGASVVLALLYVIHQRGWLMALLLLSVGMSVTTAWRTEGVEIEKGHHEMMIQILSRNRASVESVRSERGGWQSARRWIYYGADSTLNLVVGDRLIANCWVSPFAGGGYISLSGRNCYKVQSEVQWWQRINDYGCLKIAQLGISPDSEALVVSMLLGRRDRMSEELTASYNKSGAGHLLALSGLHLSIIYTILILLLRPMNLIPRGHVARNVVVVVLLWLYCAVVGMGASVVRAAVMLTLLRMAHLLHRGYVTLSSLLLAMCLMTLLDPSVILQVSFWLSVMAVFGIVVLAVPTMRRVERWSYQIRWGVVPSFVLESVVSLFVVGGACSLALIPLLGYTFGHISIVGIILSPLLVVLTYLILISSMVWLIVGFSTLAPLFGWLIGTLAEAQNHIVSSIAHNTSAVQYIDLEWWEMMAIYLLGIVATLIAQRTKASTEALR